LRGEFIGEYVTVDFVPPFFLEKELKRMEIDFPFFLSRVVNILFIIAPIVLIVLIIFSSTRRLQRIEDHLEELVEEVKKLTSTKES
jgi:large-conductance mechanosensitive channel